MSFADRPPSQAWEHIAPTPVFADGMWAWWKPPQAPHGVMVRLPDGTFAASSGRAPATMRSVLLSLGIDPQVVGAWSVRGASYAAQQGRNPLLDAPLPPPMPGHDPTILILFAQAPMTGPPMFAPPPGAP